MNRVFDFSLSLLNNKLDKEMENSENSHIDKILSDLKFICKIQKGDKINSKFKFVQPNDMITSLTRTLYYRDNRNNSLVFINNTINACFNIVRLYRHSTKESERIISNNIISDLNSSIIGIDNLKEVYINDILFCCKLETICENVKAKLKEYE